MTSGDREAEFVAFTAAHRRDLVRTATLLCAGDATSAEDVVQITLTRLFLRWSRVRRAENALAYARRSLTNVFLDEVGRAHRRREAVAAHPEAAEGDRAASPEDVVLRRLVVDALATLAPRQRAVVVLRHFHDLDVARTAEVLGCSTGTVKSQNARALAHLRSVLEAEPDALETCP